jgi:hypothetical protein
MCVFWGNVSSQKLNIRQFSTIDFLNLPDHIRENENFMTLIDQACSARADRLTSRHNIAHRLRLLEMTDDKEGAEALRGELRAADDALHEVHIMIDSLKALVVKLSQPVTESGEEGLALNSGSTSDINSSGSDHSVLVGTSGLSFDRIVSNEVQRLTFFFQIYENFMCPLSASYIRVVSSLLAVCSSGSFTIRLYRRPYGSPNL